MAIVPNHVAYKEIAVHEQGLYVANLNRQQEIARSFSKCIWTGKKIKISFIYNKRGMTCMSQMAR